MTARSDERRRAGGPPTQTQVEYLEKEILVHLAKIRKLEARINDIRTINHHRIQLTRAG